MRSFASRNPSADGTPSEKRFGIFCHWITAVAGFADIVSTTAGRSAFDKTKWMTCKPWLSYNELFACYMKFKDISVGTMQCGSRTLTNEQVGFLVMFERRMSRGRQTSVGILEIMLQMYRKTATRRTARTVVFKDVNLELQRRGMLPLLDNAPEWLHAIQELGEQGRENHYHILAVERILPTPKQIEEVLLMYYTVGVEDVAPNVYVEISEYFRIRDLHFCESDLAWQTVLGKYPKLTRIDFDLDAVILQWFTPWEEGTPMARRSEIIDVVNFGIPTPICKESHMWTHSLTKKFTRRHHIDYGLLLDTHFELSEFVHPLTTIVAQVKLLSRVQVPFLLRALKCKTGYRPGDVEVYLRKKQPVNWNWVVRHYLVPGRGETTSFLNFWLQYNGYEPYKATDKIWEFTKFYKLRRDVRLAMEHRRDMHPVEFLPPPNRLKMVVGLRKCKRIYKPNHIDDAPVPLHPKRTRLLLNRTCQWALKSKSLEWLWAIGIRQRSRDRIHKEELNMHKEEADEYNPQPL